MSVLIKNRQILKVIHTEGRRKRKQKCSLILSHFFYFFSICSLIDLSFFIRFEGGLRLILGPLALSQINEVLESVDIHSVSPANKWRTNFINDVTPLIFSASDTHPDLADLNWYKYSTGALSKMVLSEHIDEVWGVHYSSQEAWYKRGVTSETPEGSGKILF